MSDSTGFISTLAKWFVGSSEYKPKLKKKSDIENAIEQVEKAEKLLTTVEEATIKFTIDDLSEEDRAEWEEENKEDKEDWF